MEFKLETRDEIKLYCVKDIPQKPKAIIIIVHGFAEHLGRYEYVKEKLNESGFGVYRFDNRGHGKSEGVRGHIKSFMDFVYDTDEVVNVARREYPHLPIFMLGHSMGGFITCCYGIQFPTKLAGQVLSGAAVRRVPQVEGIKGSLLEILSIFFPKLRIKNELSDDICGDEKVVRDYKEDSLVLKDATLSFYSQFLIKGTRWIEKNIGRYKYPCFIIHGEEDKIVPSKTCEYLYKNISSSYKQIKIYKGLFHEIMNEKKKNEVIKDIVIWIKQRLYVFQDSYN